MLVRAIVLRFARMALLLLFVAVCTVALTRYAPGYLSDVRELDTQYAGAARQQIAAERRTTLWTTLLHDAAAIPRGDFGTSRQFNVPVAELLRERLPVSLSLLGRGIGIGWLLAFTAAVLASGIGSGEWLISAPVTVLIAVPTAAMATACLLANKGGPVLVLALLTAARDFKFLQKILAAAWTAPHILYARAQGLGAGQIFRRHVLRTALPQLGAVATLSFVTALGALVPVEVIFNVSGIGQLAWSAVMNRDLPVMLAATLTVTLAVAVASGLSGRMREAETA